MFFVDIKHISPYNKVNMTGKMPAQGRTGTHDPSYTRPVPCLLSYPDGLIKSMHLSHYTPPSHKIGIQAPPSCPEGL